MLHHPERGRKRERVSNYVISTQQAPVSASLSKTWLRIFRGKTTSGYTSFCLQIQSLSFTMCISVCINLRVNDNPFLSFSLLHLLLYLIFCPLESVSSSHPFPWKCSFLCLKQWQTFWSVWFRCLSTHYICCWTNGLWAPSYVTLG